VKRTDQQKWVDVRVIRDLEQLIEVATEALISIHRVNAINSKGTLTGDPIEPWTEEQYTFIEEEKLDPIHRKANMIPKGGSR
jgi:hypothetical protein